MFEPWVLRGFEGIQAGDEVIVLTWLDRARRGVPRVHPRGDVANPKQGVFNTRWSRAGCRLRPRPSIRSGNSAANCSKMGSRCIVGVRPRVMLLRIGKLGELPG